MSGLTPADSDGILDLLAAFSECTLAQIGYREAYALGGVSITRPSYTSSRWVPLIAAG